MRIWTCEGGQIAAARSLQEALRFEHGTAAFVGGGGKSTLIARLAQEFRARGARVIVTTTTHIRVPMGGAAPGLCFYDPADEAGIAAALARGEIATVGRNDRPGKLCGGTEEELFRLRTLCDALLVEADGAHERPMKAPEDWEPALPAQADLVVGVAGALALGTPVGACHRPQRVAAVCGKTADQFVTPQDLARVLFSPQGQRKGVACRYEAVINQADAGERLKLALAAARLCPRAVLCGRGEDDAL